MATGFIGKQGGWRNRQISLNNMQKIEFTESQGFWNNYAPKREVNEKFGQYFFSNGRRITFGTGGGPQRLDHLRCELSYSQKLKKL